MMAGQHISEEERSGSHSDGPVIVVLVGCFIGPVKDGIATVVCGEGECVPDACDEILFV